ncbi:MAG: amidohydrolase family protein [Acidobacteriota bacterium]
MQCSRRRFLGALAPMAIGMRAQVVTAAGQPAARATVLDNLVLVDGTGAPAVPGLRLVVVSGRLQRVGRRADVPVPDGAELVDLRGRTVMPGLVDAHFHIEDDPKLALRQLANGVTAFRDPGAWLEKFEGLKGMIAADGLPGPRLSLCGPHIDGPNPAYPKDSVVARDPDEARALTERNIRDGATAIKIYFRLPLASVRAVVEVCHAHGVPCTAHLEVLDARDARRAGLDGIEHITSFGTCVVPPMRAERYRQAVLADNDARDLGRYALFSEADFERAEARDLFAVVQERRPFVDATLAVFEVRATQPPAAWPREFATAGLEGYANMQRLALHLHQQGARLVLGGHSTVPFAARGAAPLRELELLVESGVPRLDAIRAATLTGAEFLRIERDTGSLVAGKSADLLVLAGNPADDISAIRRLERVMMQGRWIDLPKYRAY